MGRWAFRIFWIAVFVGVKSQAYPSYIGYGHSTCLACHFNAYGGGLVTAYGRAFDASTIARTLPFTPAADDELLARWSNFLGPIAYPKWIQTQARYRGSYAVTNIQKAASGSWSNELADFALGLKPAPWLWAVGSIGYEPNPVATSYPDRSWVTREHYVAIEPVRRVRVYGGLMDSIYGIRVPEGNVYSRTKTGMGTNAQSHGVLAHYATDHMDVGVQWQLGNYLAKEKLRETGVVTQVEMEPVDLVRIGASAAFMQNQSSNRYMGALFTRVSAGEGSSVLSELGLVRNRIYPNPNSEPYDLYFLLQTWSRFARGAHFILTSEFQTDSILGPATRNFRVAPGVLYAPMQRLELRADIRATRTIGGAGVEPDGVDFWMRVFLWL